MKQDDEMTEKLASSPKNLIDIQDNSFQNECKNPPLHPKEASTVAYMLLICKTNFSDGEGKATV